MRACLLSAALSLPLLSCAADAGIAILADPRWWEAASASVEAQARRLAGERGLRLDIIVSSESAVPPGLIRRPPRVVLAGPLSAVPVSALAAALPDTIVLSPGAGPAAAGRAAGRPNVATLRYAPEGAFAEAGRRAAEAGGSCLVAIIAAPGSGAAAAFREGFGGGGAGPRGGGARETQQTPGPQDAQQRLRERIVAANADRARLRSALDELHAEGARLFVVAMGTLTPLCLEMLEGRGSLAVVEGQEASGAFAEVVQASVEPDWAAAIAAALDRPARPARPGDAGDGTDLELPGRLVVSQRGAGGWLCGREASPAAAAAPSSPVQPQEPAR